MDVIAQVVKDIIELKIESDNIQEDATIENMLAWYEFALVTGLLEVVYKYGELQGFVEYTMLHEIPKSRRHVYELVDHLDRTGEVLYIANCCIRDDGTRHGVMWKLFHILKERNPDFKYAVWHEGKDTMKVYEHDNKKYRRVKV